MSTSGIDFILKLNEQHSEEFHLSYSARNNYLSRHPTEIIALKCMDGRLHLPIMTRTPLGIIQPMRNLGGKFEIGWPYMNKKLKEWQAAATASGRDGLAIITYHFSKGETHRGCRGFDYDRKAAEAYTRSLTRDFDDIFGDRSVFYAIQVGIETDEEALIFHGDDPEQVLDLSATGKMTQEAIAAELQRLYPAMSASILRDLLPLVQGNLDHIQEIRASQRPVLETEHREWVLGIGQGFDWLHTINMALLVGPFSPNLAEPLGIAAKLILDNFTSGRVSDPERGMVVLASAPYHEEAGPDRAYAEKKARFFQRFFKEEILAKTPELAAMIPNIHYLTGVVNMQTRKLQAIEDASKE